MATACVCFMGLRTCCFFSFVDKQAISVPVLPDIKGVISHFIFIFYCHVVYTQYSIQILSVQLVCFDNLHPCNLRPKQAIEHFHSRNFLYAPFPSSLIPQDSLFLISITIDSFCLIFTVYFYTQYTNNIDTRFVPRPPPHTQGEASFLDTS